MFNIWLIFINITKHQNIYDMYNKIKNPMKPVNFFRYSRFAFAVFEFRATPISSFFLSISFTAAITGGVSSSSSANFFIFFWNHDHYIILQLLLLFFFTTSNKRYPDAYFGVRIKDVVRRFFLWRSRGGIGIGVLYRRRRDDIKRA